MLVGPIVVTAEGFAVAERTLVDGRMIYRSANSTGEVDEASRPRYRCPDCRGDSCGPGAHGVVNRLGGQQLAAHPSNASRTAASTLYIQHAVSPGIQIGFSGSAEYSARILQI